MAAIFGTLNDDLIRGTAAPDTLLGNAGNDTIFGGNGDDLVSGGEGDDRLYAGNGNDTVLGDGGNDQLSGGAGNDQVVGGTGDDRLNGNEGNDQLFGDEGNDRLVGGAGLNELFGGVGNDTYYVDADDFASEDSDNGIDTVFSSGDWSLGDNFEILYLTGTDNLSGTGNDLDNRISGNSGNNVIAAGAGDDTVFAQDGDDTIAGDEGSDRLIAGAGNDIITGGAGNDNLRGDAGADRFQFILDSSVASFADLGVDTIRDFTSGEDILVLDAGLFANLATNPTLTTVDSGSGRSTTGASIVYQSNTGQLFYDANGEETGFGDGGLFARLQGSPELNVASDFDIVTDGAPIVLEEIVTGSVLIGTQEAEVNDSILQANNTGLSGVGTKTIVGAIGGDSLLGDIDRDYYSFSVEAGQTISIETFSDRRDGIADNTSSVAGEVDTELLLFNSAGTLLAANDDSFGTYDSQVSHTAAASGIYYVGVAGFNVTPSSVDPFDPSSTGFSHSAGGGSYELTIAVSQV